MTSYSFGTASATLMGSTLDSAKSSSVAGSGSVNPAYDSAYRRDTGMRAGVHHHGTSPSHYHQAAPAPAGSHATATKDAAGASLPSTFSGVDTQGSNMLADYFLKQQVMLHDERTDAGRTTDISSMVAAVAAASTTTTASLAQQASAYDAQPRHEPATGSQSPSVGLPGSGVSSSGLVDPLPGFLSSLPMSGQMESKYAMMAGGNHGSHTENGSARRETPSGGLLAAAAAAAAASVVSAGGGADGMTADAGTLDGQTLGYARPTYGTSHHESAYTVDGFSFANNASSTTTLAPSLSEQSAAGMAGASTDPTSYSISALSRPLHHGNGTTAAVLLGGESGGTGYAAGSGNASGLAGPLSSVSQIPGVLSPHTPQPAQQIQQTQQQQQYYSQQPQQARSYSDYSAYYRSPSTTLGMNTAANTSAAGASPMSGTGGTSQLSAAAAAAAAAAAMSPAYYAPAYQQYMRTAGSAPYSYYYSQPSSRYLPYGAYPPVRHFVSPARPFKCETCEQSFSRNHDLKRHVKIHSGIKPHKCPKCGKSFGRSDALKRHSMVKRCRSATTSAVTSASAPQRHAAPAGHPAPLSSVPGNSRLAPVSALFSQSTMATSSGSIMSNMLSSRTNSI
ncbi:hypothetical protein IWW55_004848 [Coemansia sp. RSA 2706]|nr:hypothetical protein IWW55_004848 [Coemansia sp. RSA 2706]